MVFFYCCFHILLMNARWLYHIWKYFHIYCYIIYFILNCYIYCYRIELYSTNCYILLFHQYCYFHLLNCYTYIYIAIFKLAIAGSSSLGAQALIDALVQGLEKHQGQLRGSAVEVHGKRWEKTGKLEVEQCGTCFFLIFLGRTLGDYGKCMDAIFGFSCWVFIVVF